MRLHLIRHGESTWNVEGRLQGQTPHPRLTALGQQQASAAAESLREVPLQAIWSSDLVRAVETAEIVSQALNVDVHTTELLREQGLGDMEGKLANELEPMPTPAGQHITEIRWGGGESLEDVYLRLERLVAALREAGFDDVALVSHGDTLRVLLTLLDGRSHRDVRWTPFDNGAVVPVEF